MNIISRVGVCSLDFLDKPVDSKLSSGEIKKIELATVIARNPKVAIYDEPDTGIELWSVTFRRGSFWSSNRDTEF